MYDLIIIGAGPAGITAAVYAARKKMSVIVITGDIGGQAAWSGDIENYTGYQFITGPDLVGKFEEHMRKYGIETKEGEEVVEIKKEDETVAVRTTKGAYAAKTAIIASGKKSRQLGVPGEKEFKNRGLTYCATCDGPLFAGKDVAVIGGGNSALDATLQLVKIARRVYLITNAPGFTGDPIMLEKVRASAAVTAMVNTQIKEVIGDKMVTGIRIKKDGTEPALSVQGVFVEIGLIPNAAFAQGIDRNKGGEIKINCRNETSVPGIFAAGDVTDVPEKQIIIAAGEGAKAALMAFRYLSQMK
jgi:alkyl hydroperoxide reductase subunit F